MEYNKQKLIYVVHSDTRDAMFAFGNIKASVAWFASGSLFPRLVISDYDKCVRTIREHGSYQVFHEGQHWQISAVKMVGKKVPSRRRIQ